MSAMVMGWARARSFAIVIVLGMAAILGGMASCGGGASEPTGGETSGAEATSADADEEYGSEGGGGDSAGGADTGGAGGTAAYPPPPPPPPPTTQDTPGLRLTTAERQTVLSYDGTMLRHERDLTTAIPQSGGANCGAACSAAGAICDLATQICEIATRHPSDPELAERCQDSRRRCEEGNIRVARAGCGCQ